MLFTTSSILALLASTVVALPEALAGGGGGSWGHKGHKGHQKGHMTSSQWTSSTCKASYMTYPETKTKEITVTSTKTEYKPAKITTEVEKTYVETKYITTWVKKTSTYLEDTSTKVPYKTYKTVCHTYPVETFSYRPVVSTETKTYPEKSIETETYTKTKEVPSYIWTKTPYTETYTTVTESPYTTYYTKSTSKCDTSTGWNTWTTKGW